ncbi:MAG: ribonuclease H family protein [Alphaproteobacteria bacterium]
MITAYVDGACRGNPGPGGWGVLVELPDGSTVEHWGGNPATTNQRMELQALIEALMRTPIDQPLTVYTDSLYAVGVADPASGWRIKANRDLAADLASLMTGRDVTLKHVRGHSGVAGNERADALANRCLDGALSADRAHAAAVEVAISEAAGLCRLTGSEKQVAWALDIRREVMAALPADAPGRAELAAEPESHWWIEFRYVLAPDLAATAVRRAAARAARAVENAVRKAENRAAVAAIIRADALKASGSTDRVAAARAWIWHNPALRAALAAFPARPKGQRADKRAAAILAAFGHALTEDELLILKRRLAESERGRARAAAQTQPEGVSP